MTGDELAAKFPGRYRTRAQRASRSIACAQGRHKACHRPERGTELTSGTIARGCDCSCHRPIPEAIR
jgi:hypothetical protein